MTADPFAGIPAPPADQPEKDGTIPPRPRAAVPTPPPSPSPSPSTGPRHLKAKKHSPARNLVEWVIIIAAALLVALVIKQFLVQAFYIPSESMENTLNVGDRVLVNKLSYHMHAVHRGDIVVFKRPPSEAGEPAIKDLIKRVIGIPGDTIEARDGVLYLNGVAQKEPYVEADRPTYTLPRQVVPPGKYFVMGDNRTNSKDARVFGPIPRSLIVGRAFVRVYPISAFHFL